MKHILIFLWITSVAALAQKLPSPDTAEGKCPKGWYSTFKTIATFGPNATSPWFVVGEPCYPDNLLTGLGDYYLSTERKTKDRDGNPGIETSFRQYGKTWSHQINGFRLWGIRQMKVDEVFENRLHALQNELKNRDARLVASHEDQDQWSHQESLTYRDGPEKVFIKLFVGCNVIVEERVRVKCDSCDEDAIGSRESEKLVRMTSLEPLEPCR